MKAGSVIWKCRCVGAGEGRRHRERGDDLRVSGPEFVHPVCCSELEGTPIQHAPAPIADPPRIAAGRVRDCLPTSHRALETALRRSTAGRILRQDSARPDNSIGGARLQATRRLLRGRTPPVESPIPADRGRRNRECVVGRLAMSVHLWSFLELGIHPMPDGKWSMSPGESVRIFFTAQERTVITRDFLGESGFSFYSRQIPHCRASLGSTGFY